MHSSKLLLTTITALLMANGAQAARNQIAKPVLADADLLNEIGAEVLAVEPTTHVGFAKLSAEQASELSKAAHERGSCAGFEELRLPISTVAASPLIANVFGDLAAQAARNQRFQATANPRLAQAKPEITAALAEVSDANVKATVEFLSNFPTRDNSDATANEPIEAMKKRIEGVLKDASMPYQIDVIGHQSTEQKSIRVHIPGSQRPNEILVLGGHVDSINASWGGDQGAPGADDNASGSADLLEALRIFSHGTQPQRSVEFFWYAGEESGLLGSAEIAADYKKASKDVVGVVQLDMTSFPGEGEFVLGSMTDFTSAWMRNYFASLNSLYINAKILDDQCGYGCSDHASWHRQGYPTLMPFESSFAKMNHKLHTSKDLIDQDTNFRHAAMFAKIVLAVAMDLGNSTDRQP